MLRNALYDIGSRIEEKKMSMKGRGLEKGKGRERERRRRKDLPIIRFYM